MGIPHSLTLLICILAVAWAALANFTTAESMLHAIRNTHRESADFEAADDPKPFHRHIVAVGDLHGDYPNARKVLEFSGVTDKNGDWSGNVDFFIQTGDIIDRGDDTIQLFSMMDKLRSQAKAVGGTVLSVLGNHEWMNAIGDWRYVLPSEIETFGGIEPRQKVLSTGWIGRSWATNYTTAGRLPLHPSLGPPNTPYPTKSSSFRDQSQHDTGAHVSDDHPLSHAAISFVHGGLAPSYSNLAPFPSRINELGSSLLWKLQHRKQPPPHPPFPYPDLPPTTTPEEEELYSSIGPLWYRGWALEPDHKVCNTVDEVLKKTGTRRMIMGHTPDFQNIKTRCDGKIIIIDTGISHAYGGVLSALDIHYSLIPVAGKEGGVQKWVEEEVIRALYPDRKEVVAHNTRAVWGNFRQ